MFLVIAGTCHLHDGGEHDPVMYAAGLRLMEALHLRVADVDSTRPCLRVAQGKGQKDRYTL
ncbi:MAG: hypothetical protein HY704_08245, partial [Gemmatimonadetes bacterium]|nr:hypothetical protein [Gemmatimonadota bacterium]